MHLKFLILHSIVLKIWAVPVRRVNVTENEIKDEVEPEEEWVKKIHYGEYIREVLQALESDDNFKKRLENADPEYIKSGNISNDVDFLNHNVRTRLDELKRIEIQRLRDKATEEFERNRGIDREYRPKMPDHLNLRDHQRFGKDDLKKLITSFTKDLEMADKKQEDEFKRYEMEKKYEYEHKLKAMDEDKRKIAIKEHEAQLKKMKKHEKPHHPGSEVQLKEVWQEDDHLDPVDFNPDTFFSLHDLDGNGVWDEMELKALFHKELDKMYDPKDPNTDMMARHQEMERMRKHVFKEVDTDGDRLISKAEFLAETKRDEFRQDEGWDEMGEDDMFSEHDYDEFARQKNEEIQNLIQQGVIPPPPGWQGVNAPHPNDPRLQHGIAYQQAYQQPHPNEVYQQVPQGYQPPPNQVYQQSHLNQAYQQQHPNQAYQQQQHPPQYQAYQEIKHSEIPQQNAQVYQQAPGGYQAVPREQAGGVPKGQAGAVPHGQVGSKSNAQLNYNQNPPQDKKSIPGNVNQVPKQALPSNSQANPAKQPIPNPPPAKAVTKDIPAPIVGHP